MIVTWEEILKRDDIVGGEIETQEEDMICRGPIKRFWCENGLINFETLWLACTPEPKREGFGHWEKIEPHIYQIGLIIPPQDIGNGRFAFDIPCIGFAVIFPKGDSKLDPTLVHGLNLSKK